MVSSNVVVQISQDIERKLASLISVASAYSSKVHIVTDNKKINAKSLMGMMSLVSLTGDTITIQADGPDEEEALQAVIDFINQP